MGASSRPDDYDKHNMSPEQTNEFFTDYFERWRKAMGHSFFKNGQYQEFTDFYLAAHSYGGFLSSNYTLKYH